MARMFDATDNAADKVPVIATDKPDKSVKNRLKGAPFTFFTSPNRLFFGKTSIKPADTK
ncbi:hypothetical protein [uncultured Bartonella sp.]|uniref:hypothetical protein n=1 Tax=uncultured Bartonella sp. TaxID=104108 RepID=UPI00262E0032|nr:hypothetical protein [uncultured Bartonella sp.]